MTTPAEGSHALLLNCEVHSQLRSIVAMNPIRWLANPMAEPLTFNELPSLVMDFLSGEYVLPT
jgi:hypothetical protein